MVLTECSLAREERFLVKSILPFEVDTDLKQKVTCNVNFLFNLFSVMNQYECEYINILFLFMI